MSLIHGEFRQARSQESKHGFYLITKLQKWSIQIHSFLKHGNMHTVFHCLLHRRALRRRSFFAKSHAMKMGCLTFGLVPCCGLSAASSHYLCAGGPSFWSCPTLWVICSIEGSDYALKARASLLSLAKSHSFCPSARISGQMSGLVHAHSSKGPAAGPHLAIAEDGSASHMHMSPAGLISGQADPDLLSHEPCTLGSPET
jgi:hypothetical protein